MRAFISLPSFGLTTFARFHFWIQAHFSRHNFTFRMDGVLPGVDEEVYRKLPECHSYQTSCPIKALQRLACKCTVDDPLRRVYGASHSDCVALVRTAASRARSEHGGEKRDRAWLAKCS